MASLARAPSQLPKSGSMDDARGGVYTKATPGKGLEGIEGGAGPRQHQLARLVVLGHFMSPEAHQDRPEAQWGPRAN